MRDYPQPYSGLTGPLSMRTAFNVRVSVMVIKATMDTGGERGCMYQSSFQELANRPLSPERIGLVPFEAGAIALEVNTYARNGEWHGYILLTRQNDSVDYESLTRGRFISQIDGRESAMVVRQAWRKGGLVANPKMPDDLTDQALTKLGFPVLNATEAQQLQCPPRLKLSNLP